MVDTADLMEARRAVLQKYLRGEFAQAPASPRAIPRRPPGSPIPLSFGQEQLWFLTHLAPEVPAYNEAYTVCLPGPLDVAALERSFNEIIRRHEIWRTTFPTVDGQPVQVIHPAPTLRLPVVDLRELPVAGREAEALRRATEEARQPFDLAHGPLLRATLMQLDEADYRLYLTLHHAICDGVSIYNVFLPELATVYQAFARSQPSPLPEPPLQYADFAYWQRERLQGAEHTAHLAYWREQLAGPLPVLQLPTDHTRPAQQSFRGALQRLALSRRLTAALKALSQREGVTLFMTLLAAFATLLYRYTGQEDLLVGTVTGGRKRPRPLDSGWTGGAGSRRADGAI